MRRRGCHRNLSGNVRALAEAALLDQEADTESTVQGRTQDRSREFTFRCKMAECHPRGLRQISPPPSRDELLKVRPGTSPAADDKGGVGWHTIGEFFSRTFPSPVFYRPTGMWLRGQQKTVSSQWMANPLSIIRRIDGCLSQPPTARSRGFTREWQRCYRETQKSQHPRRIPRDSTRLRAGRFGAVLSACLSSALSPHSLLPDEAGRQRLHGTTWKKRQSDTWGRRNRLLSGWSPICVTSCRDFGHRCAVDMRDDGVWMRTNLHQF